MENIVRNPEVHGGKPSIKGTRIAVEHVLRQFAAGDDESALLTAYPTLTTADIRACLLFAAEAVSR